MAATLTLDEYFSLPAGRKSDELFGPMVDMTSRLEEENKCLQNRNYKMFLNTHTELFTVFRKHSGCHVIIILPKTYFLLLKNLSDGGCKTHMGQHCCHCKQSK